jgi:ribosomal protein S18 acetylase RimI-like enzyme
LSPTPGCQIFDRRKRRTGTATTLVTAALERLAKAGAKAADCLIDVENHASIGLHARVGFQRMPDCGDSYYASLPTLR